MGLMSFILHSSALERLAHDGLAGGGVSVTYVAHAATSCICPYDLWDPAMGVTNGKGVTLALS